MKTRKSWFLIVSKSAIFSLITLLALFVGVDSVAQSVTSGITYHGRLIKPDGSPVTSDNVQILIQIRTPGSENCLMYAEVQTKDLSKSEGVFSVTLNDGTGQRNDGSGLNITQVFANLGAVAFQPSN